ncbi:MAG: hypothetical protein QM648_01700 [Solirubrobacterales bacterium]
MPRAHIRDRRATGWYHLYNQGWKGAGQRPRAVFNDREDKRHFLELLARHLGNRPVERRAGRDYLHLRPLIVLLAYCVMITHFHLIVWQRDPGGIAELMNRVKCEYTKYFNRKYGNTRPLFNGPVQAKRIDSREYLRWLVAYVHKNHRGDENYEFSSHRAWVDSQQRPGWLDPTIGLAEFGEADGYIAYLAKFDAKRAIDAELGHGRR